MAHSAPHLKAQAEGRRLFIGGLNYETTDQSLQAYLATRLMSLKGQEGSFLNVIF